MPDTQVAVGLIEHRLAARLTKRIRLTPKHLDFLACIAFDAGKAQPNTRRSGGRVPLFNLIGKGCAVGRGKAHVVAVRLGLAEIERLLAQAQQHWKVGFSGGGWQVGTLRRSEQIDRADMFPASVCCVSLRREASEQGSGEDEYGAFHLGIEGVRDWSRVGVRILPAIAVWCHGAGCYMLRFGFDNHAESDVIDALPTREAEAEA